MGNGSTGSPPSATDLAVQEANRPSTKTVPFSRVHLPGSVVCLHRLGSCTFRQPPTGGHWRAPEGAEAQGRPAFFLRTRAGRRCGHFYIFLPLAETTNPSSMDSSVDLSSIDSAGGGRRPPEAAGGQDRPAFFPGTARSPSCGMGSHAEGKRG